MLHEKLTEREKQIASHLSAGLRVAGVAQELDLAENTVRNHLKHVFSKLDVHSQSELIVFVRRHPSIVAPYQKVAGVPTGSDRDLIDELAEVDRATVKRIEACATTGSGLEQMRRIIRCVLPLDEVRRHEWRVRLAAQAVAPQERAIREASGEIHRRWSSKPLRRIAQFQARGWVRPDLESEEVRRRLFSAVYAGAMALLADESPDEQRNQLAAVDEVLAEIASDDV